MDEPGTLHDIDLTIFKEESETLKQNLVEALHNSDCSLPSSMAKSKIWHELALVTLMEVTRDFIQQAGHYRADDWGKETAKIIRTIIYADKGGRRCNIQKAPERMQ